MLRMFASDPQYEEVNMAWQLNAIAHNPHMSGTEVEDPLDIKVAQSCMEDVMQELDNLGPFLPFMCSVE